MKTSNKQIEIKEEKIYKKCLLINDLPEPDFKYFSKLKALYLSSIAK